MLTLRPNCELCDTDLPPASTEARICSYECTFCADCADMVLHNVCPNCGGNLVARPIPPATCRRPGTGLPHHPASTRRHRMKRSHAEQQALSDQLRTIPPHQR